jgi:hypothetical protein
MAIAKLNGIDQSLGLGRNTHQLAHANGALRQAENGDGEAAANGLEALLRRVSEVGPRIV